MVASKTNSLPKAENTEEKNSSERKSDLFDVIVTLTELHSFLGKENKELISRTLLMYSL